MNLIIDKKYPYEFVLKLKQKFIRDTYVIVKATSNDNFIKIDTEMNKTFHFPEVILSKEIILYALDNVLIRKNSNHYTIEFNPVITYPKTRIKLITLLRFISFGNSFVHGNSLLVDELEKLNKNLSNLYTLYINLGGVVV